MQYNLQDIGLQVRGNLANTILLENTYDSNLVSDISKVDYLAGNLGATDLQPLEGLDAFVDDIFVFGYCSREQLVSTGRRVQFDPKSQAAKATVRAISGALSTAMPGKKMYDISIQNTIRTDAVGSICKTIGAIERATKGESRRKWLELRNGGGFAPNIQEQEEVCAIFVAKVDLSEYTIQRIEEVLPSIHKSLLGLGMGLYAIDYTQDFSGTVDRSKIVQHLEEQGFVEQGDFGEAIESRRGTILDNTKSVGKHVCTWVHEYEGHTIRQKLYNKFACQIEAGKVQQTLGGHIAEYAACPNTHLRKTFEHDAAKARGISRIEISVYGCSREDPLEYARIVLVETMQSLRGKTLFYIQPTRKQWTNFAEEIDRCCMFVDHSSKSISFCRYGHSRTGRLGGVVVPVGKKDIEKVAMHTMAEFGFQDCPIFRIDLLQCVEKTISLAPLRCFRKERGTKTILCPARAPTKRYPSEREPSIALPDTKHICWMWREKSTRMGMGKQFAELEEMETNRTISLLPKRQRKVLLDMFAMEEEEKRWKEGATERANMLVAERDAFARASEDAILYRERVVEYTKRMEASLSLQPQKIYNLGEIPCKFVVLGYEQRYRNSWNSGRVYALQRIGDKEEMEGDPILVQATGKLDNMVGSKDTTTIRKNGGFSVVHLYVSRLHLPIEIFVQERTTFCKEGREIPYCPMFLSRKRGSKIVQDEYQYDGEDENTTLLFRECSKEDRKAKLVDFLEGEYVCNSYSAFLYRGKERYVLYFGEKEEPAIGFWIDEKFRELHGIPDAPLLCKVGKIATTANGKKDRRIVFCIAEQKTILPTPNIAKKELETPPIPPILGQEIQPNPPILETPPQNLHIAEENQSIPRETIASKIPLPPRPKKQQRPRKHPEEVLPLLDEIDRCLVRKHGSWEKIPNRDRKDREKPPQYTIQRWLVGFA